MNMSKSLYKKFSLKNFLRDFCVIVRVSAVIRGERLSAGQKVTFLLGFDPIPAF